ncbi:MAG: EAL domain-containing protein, partial [Deltaproteobacteria bacterium]|nr:EAL domain-containing protein [Deltaproteobacteria bacterium]
MIEHFQDSAATECENRTSEVFNDLISIIQDERIYPVFQPIVSLRNGEVFGYEALARVQGTSNFDNPRDLFDYADQCCLAAELDDVCHRKALQKALDLNLGKHLFVNVSPAILEQPDRIGQTIAELTKHYCRDMPKIVLELTETMQIENSDLFMKTASYYRNQRFLLAIDDFGSGYAGLQSLLLVEPNIVKIDRFIIEDIHHSTPKRLLLESIVAFCHKINIKVVAEGIETSEELRIVAESMTDYGQGFYIGKPD